MADPLALDTNGLTALMAHEPEVSQAVQGFALALPAPVFEEALYGWILQVRRAEQRRREDALGRALDQLISVHQVAAAMTLLPYSPAAQVVYRMLTRGRGNRGHGDLRIAAICLAQGVPLLTRNVADFQDLPNLDLRTW